MEWTHEEHATYVGEVVSAEMRQKYLAGQREHGGQIWQKPRMVEHAIEEMLDLGVYLVVMRDQLQALAADMDATGQTVWASRVRFILGNEFP